MTIYRAIRVGQLPVVRVRGRLFVPARALDDLVDAALTAHSGVPAEQVAR